MRCLCERFVTVDSTLKVWCSRQSISPRLVGSECLLQPLFRLVRSTRLVISRFVVESNTGQAVSEVGLVMEAELTGFVVAMSATAMVRTVLHQILLAQLAQ